MLLYSKVHFIEMSMAIFGSKQLLRGITLTLKKGIKNRRKNIRQMPTMCHGLLAGQFTLRIKGFWCEIFCRNVKDPIADVCPLLTGQARQWHQIAIEWGALVMQLAVGHWGLQACHPESLPSTLETRDSGCGQ